MLTQHAAQSGASLNMCHCVLPVHRAGKTQLTQPVNSSGPMAPRMC